jgi:acyl carrier protein
MLTIEKELRTFILDNFLMGREDFLSNHDSFLEKGIFDSTGILELVSFLEQRYNIEMEPEELIPENLDSISSLANFLQRKLATPPAVSAMGVSQTSV